MTIQNATQFFKAPSDPLRVIESFCSEEKDLINLALSCKGTYRHITSNDNEWKARAATKGVLLKGSDLFLQYRKIDWTGREIQQAYDIGAAQGREKLQEILARPSVQRPFVNDDFGERVPVSPEVVAADKVFNGLINIVAILFSASMLDCTQIEKEDDLLPYAGLIQPLILSAITSSVLHEDLLQVFEGIVYQNRDNGLLEKVFGLWHTLPLRASLCAKKVQRLWHKLSTKLA